MKKLFLVCGIACSTILYSCVNKSKDQAKDIVDPNEKISKLAGVFTFTEGPAVDVNGDVYFTDQPTNRIIKWETSSKIFTTFLSNSGRSNGMYFDASGNLITCADMKGEIWSIDKDGNHTVLVDNYNGKLLNGPNDLWIAPNGAIYITDPLYKRGYWAEDDPRRNESQQGGNHLYYLSPDRIALKRVDENLVKPNGIVGTPDGKTLFVADIDDTKIYQYDIEEDGSLSNRKIFCEMKSDGMTIDAEGNVYLTNDLGVTAFDKSGTEIFNVPTGEGWTANVTFGGADRKTLFITAMGSVYGLPMTVSGIK
jgi:gluconolactonase